MKTNRKINGRNFLLTLLILAGCVVSCEKAEIKKEVESKAGIEVRPDFNDHRGGGDDEEDPIVDGLVVNGNGTAVANAQVQIFQANKSTPTTGEVTDGNGRFEMTVPVGSYYFKVTDGSNTATTSVIQISQDVAVTITM